MKRILLLGLLFTLVLTNCKKDDSDTPVGSGNDNPIIVPTGTSSIEGVVYDASGNPLSGVTAFAGSFTATSDADGKFKLDGIGTSNLVPVTFEKAGYVSTQKIAKTKDGFSVSIEAALIEIGNTTQIGVAGGTASHGTMEVEFPANAFVNENGNAFQGNAEVRATWFNPTDDQFLNMFPGDFEGEREDGTTTAIESFGFIDVEIWAGSQQLQLADGKTATIKVPVPAEIKANAPQTIPLWHYDMDQAKWIEDGSAELEGDFYIGEVSHFTRWNCDQPQNTSFLRGKVVDENGNPLEHARIATKGQDYTGASQAWTDSNGEFEVPVKSDAIANILASHGGWFADIDPQNTPATQTTRDIGTITIIKKEIEAPGWYQTNDFNLNNDLIYLDFIDQNNGKMIIHNHQTGSLETRSTNDGGLTWDQLGNVKNYWSRDSMPSKDVVQFYDNNYGIASAFDLHLTSDGGQTWIPQTNLPNQNFQEIGPLYSAITDQNTAYVFTITYDKNEIVMQIFKTEDFGDNWQEIESDLPLPAIKIKEILFGRGAGLSIFHMYNNDIGFIWNEEEFYKTTDGCENYTKISDLPLKEIPKGIHAISEDEILLFYSNEVYKSINGGVNWTKKFDGNSISGHFEMMNNKIWILDRGQIHYSADNGDSWSIQEYSPAISLYTIAFKDDLNGYAGGEGGFLIKTETGGVK
jgi:photosystem II stability/assembly factor-like uncharacterized protein